eukprot:gene9862-11679_t
MHKAEILAKTPKNAVQVALKPSVDQYSTDPAKCRYVNKGTVKADEKGYTDLLNDARSEWNRVENILQQLEKRVRSWLDTTEQEVAQHDSADPEDGDGLLHTVATDIGGHLEEAVHTTAVPEPPQWQLLADNNNANPEDTPVHTTAVPEPSQWQLHADDNSANPEDTRVIITSHILLITHTLKPNLVNTLLVML